MPNIWDRLKQEFAGPEKSLLCPYCLYEVRYKGDLNVCPCEAKQPIPALYEIKHKTIHPFFLQLMGWSGVGKTVYLQALTLLLRNMRGIGTTALTASADDFVQRVEIFNNTGVMPIMTQKILHDAYMIELIGLGPWGDRTLVVRDVAGETFNPFIFDIKYTPYALHVPVTLMMLNLEDTNPNRNMNDLLGRYVATLAHNDKKFMNMRREVIAVLAKADKLQKILPADVRDYLSNDPFVGMLQQRSGGTTSKVDISRYMDKLYELSNMLGSWMRECYAAADQMNTVATANNIGMHFTVITSTGAEPIEVPQKDEYGQLIRDPDSGQAIMEKQVVNMVPRRVLDPFFLALDFTSKHYKP